MNGAPRLALIAATTLALAGAASAGDERVSGTITTELEIWRQLEPGLELALFSTADTTVHPAGDLVVLRVDTALWALRLLRAATLEHSRNRNARQWCEDFGLVAAINAGMFQTDRRTHVGYLKCAGEVVNPRANSYLSAVGFTPRLPYLPPWRLFDLDVTPLDSVAREYTCVIQNLRLVKRPRESRWHRRDRAWREAALGEDGAGRALLIYCRTALTMPDLISLLLALPIDLQVAQHLEGGAEAQLYIAHPAAGEAFRREQQRSLAWPVPNVLGIVPVGD
jgi:hypothetical protein